MLFSARALIIHPEPSYSFARSASSGIRVFSCHWPIFLKKEKSEVILDELVKKGELTVEQGKVLNEELKHNIKDAIRENVTLHVVTPEEDRGEADGGETDDTAALLGWAFVWKDQKK